MQRKCKSDCLRYECKLPHAKGACPYRVRIEDWREGCKSLHENPGTPTRNWGFKNEAEPVAQPYTTWPARQMHARSLF